MTTSTPDSFGIAERNLIREMDAIGTELAAGTISPDEASARILELKSVVEQNAQQRPIGLSWPVQEDHFDESMRVDIPVLRRRDDLSFAGSDATAPTHTLIKGDNLPVLQALNAGYVGLVKLILLDPPYFSNSNEMTFQDRFERSHWLTMMALRLVAAKELLTEDGVIAVHIDNRAQADLMHLMNMVFGAKNFVESIVWRKKAGGADNSGGIATDHEYINVYSKGAKPTIHRDPMARAAISYPHTDKRGDYELKPLDMPGLGEPAKEPFPIVGPDGNEYLPRVRKGKRVGWRWGQAKVDEDYDQLVFKDGVFYTKNYRKDDMLARSVLVEAERFGRTRTGKADIKKILGDVFSYPKPVKLSKHLLRIFTQADDIVLDFFAGSGTTLQAAAELNIEDGGSRSCILVTDAGLASVEGPSAARSKKQKAAAVDIAERITYERVRRALTGQDWADGKEHPDLGQGLSVHELGWVSTVDEMTVDWTGEGEEIREVRPLTSEVVLGRIQQHAFDVAVALSAALVTHESDGIKVAVSTRAAIVSVAPDTPHRVVKASLEGINRPVLVVQETGDRPLWMAEVADAENVTVQPYLVAQRLVDGFKQYNRRRGERPWL